MAYIQQPGASGSTLYTDNDRPNMKAETSYRTEEGYVDEPFNPSPLSQPRAPFANQDRAAERVSFAPPKSTGDLRLWRHDEAGKLWTKGGGGRTALRFCLCTFFMTIFLIVSIVLALAMWLRPPNIVFNGVQLPTDTSAVQASASTLEIFVDLSISVANPNFFGVGFKSITAKAFYPPLTPQLGGGRLNNIDFPANSKTTFQFPFNITYTMSEDPTNILVTDLVKKCGIIPGSAVEQLSVNYDLELAIKIFAITITPSFSGTASFDCPVTQADLDALGASDLIKQLTGA